MPYVGNKSTTFNTFSATDVSVTDDLTVTDDASVGGTLGVTGVVTANAGVVVDNITIDGTEIDLSSGDLTIDVAGNLTIDSDGGNILLKDGGTDFGQLASDSNSKFLFYSAISDGDIIFQGNDGGSTVTALTLDMSDAGAATLNNGLTLTNGDIVFGTSSKGIVLGATSNTDANTLEDYEEGTWTPGQGDGLTVNGSFSSSGKYTKIGRMVYIRGSVSVGYKKVSD